MKSAQLVFAAATLALLVTDGPSALAQNEPQIYQSAPFVFDGTVVKTHASSSAEIPTSQNTMVVRADSVLKRPPSVAFRNGEEVTVAVSDSGSLRLGQRARFFADGVFFGKGIEVREIIHTALPTENGPGQPAAPSGEKLKKAAETARLRQQVNAAAAIVVGRVVAVTPAPLKNKLGAGHVSEHDADWQSAVVEVQSVVKGAPGKQVVVNFPGSMDVAWINDPKLKTGQEATLVLNHDHASGLPSRLFMAGAHVTAYTALRPGDVLPVSDAARLRELATQ
jgi:hypothetical protein